MKGDHYTSDVDPSEKTLAYIKRKLRCLPEISLHQTILDSIETELYICDKEYRITYLNKAAEKRFGKNTLGEFCFKALYDADSPCNHCRISKTIDENKEHRQLWLSPTNKWPEEIVFKPIRLSDNATYALVEINKMVFSSHNLLLEDTMTNVFETLPLGVFFSTVEGKFLYVNQALATMFNYSSPEEMMQIVNASDIPSSFYLNKNDRIETLSLILSSSEWQRYELPLVTKNKEVKEVSIIYRAVRDKENNISHIQGFIENISLHKATQRGLIQQRNYSGKLITQSPMMIIGLNAYGQTMLMNPAAEMLTGYKAEDLLGKNWWETLYPGNLRNNAEQFYSDLKEKGVEFIKEYEMPLLTKTGERKLIEWSLLSDINVEQEIILFGRDVTVQKHLQKELCEERKNLENTVAKRTSELNDSLRRLEESNKSLKETTMHKMRFMSSMSHELRTPLNAIIGFAELLNSKYYGMINEKQQEYVSLIKESGDHLLTIINNLLDLEKANIESMNLQKEQIYLEDYLPKIVKTMSPQYEKKNIKLDFSIDENIEHVFADRVKLKQIMLNLLSNALKFTPPQGIVSIEVKLAQQDFIVLHVKDTGVGIEEEELEKIFEEFYQSKNIKNYAGGTGIGLALTKKLVELHGGAISVQSVPEKGSQFSVFLPLS